MQQPQQPSKKRLIILGGGYTGISLLTRLEKIKGIEDKLEIILVDKKEYFECNLASVSFLIDPQLYNGLARNFTTYLKHAQFICAEIQLVTPQEVILHSPLSNLTTSLSYNYLAVCLGTNYPYFKPDTRMIGERQQEVTTVAQRVRDAEHVLVIGGRGVGVELVGEIVEQYPGKKVTIVHPGKSLMDIWPQYAIDKLYAFLSTKKNLNIICNTRVSRSEGNRHELTNGQVLEADLALMTAGGYPNTEAFRTHFSSTFTPRGYLKVDENMSLVGYSNIFAIGDIADTTMNRTLFLARYHVRCVVGNISNLLKDKPLSPLKITFAINYPPAITVGTYVMFVFPWLGWSFCTNWIDGRWAYYKFKQIVDRPDVA